MVRENPKHGSFGDFVWILDVSSGHVISAELDGIVLRRVEFGPLHRTVEARIRASMTTVRSAGFRAQRQILGQRVFDLCDADDGECTLVAPVPYDPRTGYVNAVGVISARTRGAGAGSRSRAASRCCCAERPRARADAARVMLPEVQHCVTMPGAAGTRRSGGRLSWVRRWATRAGCCGL